jgi:hypothetical protein
MTPVHTSDALTTGRSSGSYPCANRIACRAFSYSFPDLIEVCVSCSKTFPPLLDRAPSLVHAWLVSGLKAHVECFAYPPQLFRCYLPFQRRGPKPLFVRFAMSLTLLGRLFGIQCAISTNLARTHASCRTVALNATYRDFGTTHILATLTFGAETGSTL